MELSIRQQAFVSRYLQNGLRNAADAATEAGYTKSSSRVRGHRLLKRPEIQ
ncbi:MAG: hypothetical protein HOL17_01415 [Gammaproteobacteria bacterium]|jgi:phage terminase small subunit|nr:hypothetical protein [Candidatus Neomarinimicrobiota bacterium]MBT4607786.1 hypothetical protein [Thiotrichales bacterium]MBT5370364.1 hypothetical protein [Gammaproteobacteria bacterium]MBT7831539.1 hypothetical protein [Candidatus Neomarinimicrobiota bacterium]